MEFVKPEEVQVYGFLQKAMAGETTMPKEVAKQVASDVEAALYKQFDSGPRDDFRLRMSNIGRPKCQLWFEKNQPEEKTPLPPHFLINMILGDIVEAVFKGLLRAAGIQFKDNDYVTLELSDGTVIKGEYDMELDGKIDDVKSASPWSYQNKFTNFETLNMGDTFGYIPQLVGYAVGAGKDVGGWWVVNKGTGEFKYVSAADADVDEVIQQIEDLVNYINNDEPFERCFEPIPETYRKKPSGNLVLPKPCHFCSFKYKCHPTLQTMPSRVSQAVKKPEVEYVFIGDENNG